VPADAPLVSRLRAAGAVILGKTNLGEWANFRGFIPFDPVLGLLAVGWSARGGNTVNPYVLSYTPWGSSSGSGVAAAANLCAAADRLHALSPPRRAPRRAHRRGSSVFRPL